MIFIYVTSLPFAGFSSGGTRGRGLTLVLSGRQRARGRERFLSPRAYRLLEISPAFNETELQKAQNAAILLNELLAEYLKLQKLWNISRPQTF